MNQKISPLCDYLNYQAHLDVKIFNTYSSDLEEKSKHFSKNHNTPSYKFLPERNRHRQSFYICSQDNKKDFIDMLFIMMQYFDITIYYDVFGV